MAKVKGYFKRKDKKGRNVVWVREWCITDAEREEVKVLQSCGYSVELAKKTVKTEAEPHEITKDFNISYDEIRKEDMIKYIEAFVKDKELIKKFAKEAHPNKKFVMMIAKKSFFRIFFPERWEKEIEPMLKERQFKKSTKEAEADFFAQYLD